MKGEASIGKLLRKRNWTGADLGRIEIAMGMEAYIKITTGKPADYHIPPEKFNSELSEATPEMMKIYNGYLSIHRWLNERMTLANSMGQQLLYRAYQLSTILKEATAAENIARYSKMGPKIITKDEYKSREKKKLDNLSKQRPYTLFNILMLGIEFYTTLLRTNPRKQNPLKKVRPVLDDELITDPQIIDRYLSALEIGYFQLENGMRSDETSKDDWMLAICPEGASGRPTEQVISDLIDRHHDFWKARIDKGDSYNEALTRLTIIDDMGGGIFSKANWNAYKSTGQDEITKWDIFSSCHIPECLPSIKCKIGETPDEAAIAEFVAMFNPAIKEILADMEENGISNAASLPFSTWGNISFPQEAIYIKNLYGFKDKNTIPAELFPDDQQVRQYGLAIAKYNGPPKKAHQAKADQGQQVLDKMAWEMSLDEYIPRPGATATSRRLANTYRELVRSSLHWISGYNAVLDLIADIYTLPEIEPLKLNLEAFVDKVEQYNFDISTQEYVLRCSPAVQNRREKLAALHAVFRPINISEETKILEDSRIKTIGLFHDEFTAFTDQGKDPCTYLCFTPPEKD